MTDYEQGRHDCNIFYHSQMFASFYRHVQAEDAAKLFLTPVKEMLTQISMPLPKPRKDWLNGFKSRQSELNLEELDYRRLLDKSGLVSDDLK